MRLINGTTEHFSSVQGSTPIFLTPPYTLTLIAYFKENSQLVDRCFKPNKVLECT